MGLKEFCLFKILFSNFIIQYSIFPKFGFGSEIGCFWVSQFAITPAKCRLGRVQRNPTKPGVGSNQPTKCKVAQDRTNSQNSIIPEGRYLDIAPDSHIISIYCRNRDTLN